MFHIKNLFVSSILLYACISYSTEHITPGIVYEHSLSQNPTQSIHLVTIDPAYAYIITDTAQSKCIGCEKTSEIALRSNALVAVNGSFFDFDAPNKLSKMFLKALDALGYSAYNTVPVYGLKIKDSWFSLSHLLTGVIGWEYYK